MIRLTQMTVAPKDDSPLFDERAFRVQIVDEAAGEFVEVSGPDGKIQIDPQEWPELRTAITNMIDECRI